VRNKTPNMVIFWAETKKPLTHLERKALEFKAVVVSVTPREILLEVQNGHARKVIICGITAPDAPVVPDPQSA
jgi:hypothetical protein